MSDDLPSDPRTPLRPPTLFNVVLETLAPLDLVGLPGAMLRARRSPTRTAESLPIIVLPGLGTGDTTMAPLRFILNQVGHRAEGWGLGINTGGRNSGARIEDLSESWDVDRSRPDNGEAEVPALCDQMAERTKRRSDELGEPVVLIGWSLGGYVAREVARDLPERVRAVITLASPVVGGPKYTTAAEVFRRRNVDVDWIADETMKRFERPITQPITAIYSRRDGVVGWESAIDHWSPNVNHVEVGVSHLGAGLNRRVVDVILAALDETVTGRAS